MHYPAFVIVPFGPDYPAIVAHLLAPYNESIPVDSYDEKCDFPNPDCPDCHGSGIINITYNPDARWDSYRIGGRWDGALAGKNTLPVIKLFPTLPLLPNAIVTPDGEWHQADTSSPNTWPQDAIKLLSEHWDDMVVLIDYHQ